MRFFLIFLLCIQAASTSILEDCGSCTFTHNFHGTTCSGAGSCPLKCIGNEGIVDMGTVKFSFKVGNGGLVSSTKCEIVYSKKFKKNLPKIILDIVSGIVRSGVWAATHLLAYSDIHE